MRVRPADLADRSRVREIARDSFQSSYALSPQEIDALLEASFSDAALGDRIDASDVLFLVAEHDVDGTDGVSGFVDAVVGDEGTIRWLHVDPEARGRGLGTALVERVRDELGGGTPLAARVLADAAEGGEFCEQFGLKRSGSDRSEFGSEEYSVALFAEGARGDDPNEPSVAVPGAVDVDGAERPVDRDAPIPGTDAPFFRIYAGETRDEQYGYFCSQCGSTDVSADGLDRLECGNCGNEHLADKWDDSYL